MTTRATILDFVAGKRAFYLDGRLYYFLEDGVKPGLRGTPFLADWDLDDASLVLSSQRGQPDLRIPLNTEVTFQNDVGVFLGASHDYATNRLKRYAHTPPYDIAMWQRVKRVTMGVVDYHIVRDNVGKTRKNKLGETVQSSPSDVTKVPDAFGARRDAYVFETFNDDTPDKRGSLVVPADTDWVCAGPMIAFTTVAESEAGRSFV